MKHLKTLSLAAVLALALSACVGVASASASVGVYIGGTAEAPKFEAEEYQAQLSFSPLEKTTAAFNFFRGPAQGYNPEKCESINSSYSGSEINSFIGASEKILPTYLHYGKCTSWASAAVTMVDSCFPTLTVDHGSGFLVNFGKLGVLCQIGHELEFKRTIFGALICTAKIKAGDLFGGEVTYVNVGSGSERYLQAIVNAKEIPYTLTGAGCYEPGAHNDGTWTSAFKVQGF